MQLVVPVGLREKVVALAHDTLLSGHRDAAKTLRRVQQEFSWPGIHNFVTRCVARHQWGKCPWLELIFNDLC